MTAANVVKAVYLRGDRLEMRVCGHSVFCDQPVGDGGDDTAPTPTELFIAGLAGCIGFYAERFLRRSRLSTDGLEVECAYTWAEGPHRVGQIAVKVVAPSLPNERREAFERVVGHCTIHNTLQSPPTVTLEVQASPAAAASVS